jgi:hypothetical protein
MKRRDFISGITAFLAAIPVFGMFFRPKIHTYGQRAGKTAAIFEDAEWVDLYNWKDEYLYTITSDEYLKDLNYYRSKRYYGIGYSNHIRVGPKVHGNELRVNYQEDLTGKEYSELLYGKPGASKPEGIIDMRNDGGYIIDKELHIKVDEAGQEYAANLIRQLVGRSLFK